MAAPFYILMALILVLAVGPLLIPVPPVAGTRPAQALADTDSRFVTLNGVNVHYKLTGQGEPVLALLHGFGASTFSWREVVGPLSQQSTVLTFDRPGAGLTTVLDAGSRSGPNPYSAEAQADLLIALLDHLEMRQAILVGNSAGGTSAVLAALRHPMRVQALVLVDAAIYAGGAPAWICPLSLIPQLRRLGPLFVRSVATRRDEFLRLAWYDPSKITDEIRAGYDRPFQVHNWDRALWQLTLANRPLNLAERLDELNVPALVITGAEDRIVPAEQSVRLAQKLPQAHLVVLPRCGHLPQEECPEAFLQALDDFLVSLGVWE